LIHFLNYSWEWRYYIKYYNHFAFSYFNPCSVAMIQQQPFYCYSSFKLPSISIYCQCQSHLPIHHLQLQYDHHLRYFRYFMQNIGNYCLSWFTCHLLSFDCFSLTRILSDCYSWGFWCWIIVFGLDIDPLYNYYLFIFLFYDLK